MAALFNEGRPGMLLEESVVQAQRALISIMLELAEFSGCACCSGCFIVCVLLHESVYIKSQS